MRSIILSLGLVLGTATTANALNLPVTTTSFGFDGSFDGVVTGTLGANLVTFTTDPGLGFSGFNRWDLSEATDDLVTFESQLGFDPGVATSAPMGANGNSTVEQTISFSETIMDPTLLISNGSPLFSMDFGATILQFLDSNNALLSGSIVTFPGSVGSRNDGFGATVFGTYGPGNPLTFSLTNTGSELDDLLVTVGTSAVAESTDIPEPASLALFGLGLLGLGLGRRQRRVG